MRVVNVFHSGPDVDAPDPKFAPLIGRLAPDFRLRDLNGKELQLSSLRGKAVVLDFWATWCGPCREEMPKLERLSREFAKSDVVIIGIDVSEPEDTVRRFINKNKYTYPVLLTQERDSVFDSYSVHGYPTLFTVDRSGIVVSSRLGTRRDSEQHLRAALNRMLQPAYVSPKPIAPAKVPATTEPLTARRPEPKTSEAFARRGWSRLRQRQYTDALSDANSALALKPNSEAALHLRATIEYDVKSYPSAIRDYSALLEKHPDWMQVHNQRGLAYSDSGRSDLAIADFTKAIQLDRYAANLYANRGRAYLELGQLKQARTDLDRAIDLQPAFTSAYENRARLFDQTREFQNELADLDAVLSLNAPNDWAREQRKRAERRLAIANGSAKLAVR
jgi:tetratricopeptide (TPR) repeat protein